MNENQTPASTTTVSPILPTKKQKELLGFISQFIAEHGYSPSYREIMQGLQYTSVATVALHVTNLITRGHLRKRDHSARSLEVVGVDAPPSGIRTNEVKATEERWLSQKIEYLFSEAESQALPDVRQIADLQTMLQALRILGLEGAAQSFRERLSRLVAALQPKA